MVRIAADLTPWIVERTPLVELARLSPSASRLVGKLVVAALPNLDERHLDRSML
ncbi:MAG: hypothetical protein ABIP94_01250 [Planctomycetota bacterium]